MPAASTPQTSVTKAPLLLRLLFGLLSYVPVTWMGKFGTWVGLAFYYIDKRHRTITLSNLARVFPEKQKKERIRLAKRSFAQVGRTLLEIPYVFMRSRQNLLAQVQIEGEEVLREALAQEKGVFLMAAHYSNWELMGLMPSLLGYQTSTIYRQLNQAPLEHLTSAARSRFGTHLYPRRHTSLRWLFSALKKNHCIIVALDQHMGAGNGVPVPFLGHISSTTQLPASFVQKNKTPMVGMALERLDNTFKFRLRFWKIATPELNDDKKTNEIKVMTAACSSFDQLILKQPEQWLWMHRRWRAVEIDANMRDIVHGAP
ncbi:MAG: lysophospholipid acyltransferase family protein [Ghiorsea sp.]